MYEGFRFFETRGDRFFPGLPVGINRGYGKSFKALYDSSFELIPKIERNKKHEEKKNNWAVQLYEFAKIVLTQEIPKYA